MLQRLLPAVLALCLPLAACGSASLPPAGPVQLGPQLAGEVPTEPLTLDEGQAPLPAPAIDRRVFGEAGELGAQATFLTCRNEPSGPYYRLQTDPVATGPVNLIQGLGTLPALAAGATAFPYLYLGGQPRAGLAADAGVYANAEGAWIPVVNVEGAQRNIPRETGEGGRVYVYRLPGGQAVQLRMWVPQDGQLQLDITGDWIKYELVNGKVVPVGPSGPATRTIRHPGATGWTALAPEQVFKAMTSVAFPGKGNFKLLTGSYAYTGSGWANLAVGRAEGQTRPFTPALLYSACAAPADVVTPRPTAELPSAGAEIRLRRLTRLDLSPGASFDFAAPVSQRAVQPLGLSNAGPADSLARYQIITSGTVAPAGLGAQGAVRAARGVLAGGARADLGLSAQCWPTPGPYLSRYALLYAVGETYDGSEPSALDGAQKGDLLYRQTTLTGRLNCVN